jgi:acetyl esterase/lipase
VFVNYTRSPEAHYPVAINQAYNATKWVAEYGNEIGVDGKRLAVAKQCWRKHGYRCCNDG